jgi:hypothetical protein
MGWSGRNGAFARLLAAQSRQAAKTARLERLVPLSSLLGTFTDSLSQHPEPPDVHRLLEALAILRRPVLDFHYGRKRMVGRMLEANHQRSFIPGGQDTVLPAGLGGR